MKKAPKITLLVDSEEFWTHLERDLVETKSHIYVQTFALEGDTIGNKLSDLLLNLDSVDTKIMVDDFSKVVINDKLIHNPINILDVELQREIADTSKLMDKLKRGGVDVKYINPVGFLFTKIFARNHKKLVLIDGKTAYIGGMNFCEHNFSWHDLMLRIEDSEIARMLECDFIETWNGNNICTVGQFEDIEIHSLNGRLNHLSFDTILQLIDNAKSQIFVESPYITFPIIDALGRARSRGVSVTIIAPEANNWQLFKGYIIGESAKHNFNLMFYPERMNHLKAILIDDDFLVLGSSNFDFASFSLHQELLAVITASDLIASFKEKVMIEDLNRSKAHCGGKFSLRQLVVRFAIRVLVLIVVKTTSAIRG